MFYCFSFTTKCYFLEFSFKYNFIFKNTKKIYIYLQTKLEILCYLFTYLFIYFLLISLTNSWGRGIKWWVLPSHLFVFTSIWHSFTHVKPLWQKIHVIFILLNKLISRSMNLTMWFTCCAFLFFILLNKLISRSMNLTLWFTCCVFLFLFSKDFHNFL